MQRLLKSIFFFSITFFGIGMGCSQKSSQVENIGEWEIIFDGSSTDKLRGYGMDDFPFGIWHHENDMLIANQDTTGRDLITKKEYSDFEMTYEWSVDTAANSGVYFHLKERKDDIEKGNFRNWGDTYEVQVLDDQFFPDTLKNRSAGSIYNLIAPVNKKLKPIGEFNQARLIHEEGKVKHWLNGNKVLDFEINSKEIQDLIKSIKPNNYNSFHQDTTGYIMFQHHGQRVYYKNIKIREL